MKTLILVSLLAAFARPVLAGLLNGQGAFVLDTTNAPRATFTNSERIVFQQKVFNSVASSNRIVFRFVVQAPSGAKVFEHAGNAVAGSVGNAASQVSGIPISQFYAGPGSYTLQASAELDGQVLMQPVSFTVSSPNILLIYPPNGARNLADNPLTFRWSASGATRYRVTVGDNPSLYNSVFNQETGGSESSLTYPQNPTDVRQRLTAGQVYYWMVEGLDASGNVIARSQTPGDFSVQATAVAKDLAVSDFAVDGAIDPNGGLKLRVAVKNQGNTTENAINLRVGVGGLPAANTPIALNLFNPAEVREFTVQASIPSDQKQTLATACIELFDDNVPNNCRTLSVTRPDAPAGAPGPMAPSLLSVDKLRDMLRQLLKERGIDADAYDLDELSDPNELAALIDGLREGSVQVTVTGPVMLPPVAAPPQVVRAPEPAAPALSAPPAAPEAEEPSEAPEWAGMARSRAKQAYSWVIRDRATWEKAWKLLRGEGAPKVDFRKNVIVGVAAGAEETAERVEIQSVQEGSSGVVVRYRLVGGTMLHFAGGRRPAARAQVPYVMRQVAASPGSEVQFERMEDYGGDR